MNWKILISCRAGTVERVASGSIRTGTPPGVSGLRHHDLVGIMGGRVPLDFPRLKIVSAPLLASHVAPVDVDGDRGGVARIFDFVNVSTGCDEVRCAPFLRVMNADFLELRIFRVRAVEIGRAHV